MQCIIDRFEGDYAIIEYNDQVLKLPKVFLPLEVLEGDVLDVLVMLDENETIRLNEEIIKLVEVLWE
jgi:hypothetical protein